MQRLGLTIIAERAHRRAMICGMARVVSKKTAVRAAAPANRLRIIGGRWRGVPIDFPPIDAVRPSPDRVRETLFNWLQSHILGTRCLDLFAGSGALGVEALSRGAAHVTFVDRDPQDRQASCRNAQAARRGDRRGRHRGCAALPAASAADVRSGLSRSAIRVRHAAGDLRCARARLARERSMGLRGMSRRRGIACLAAALGCASHKARRAGRLSSAAGQCSVLKRG